MLRRKRNWITNICGPGTNRPEIEPRRRIIPKIDLPPDLGTLNRSHPKIDARGDQESTRLKESLASITEVLKQASFKAKPPDLVSDYNINLLWQFDLSRQSFNKDNLTLKAVDGADVSRQFQQHAPTVKGINASGSKLAGNQAEYSCAGPKVKNYITNLQALNNRLSKSGQASLVGEITTMFLSDFERQLEYPPFFQLVFEAASFSKGENDRCGSLPSSIGRPSTSTQA